MLKKIVKSLALFTTLVLLVTGCGSKPIVETSLTTNQGGIDQVITFFSQGDKVVRQTTTNTVSYTALGVSTEEEARALLDPIGEDFQGINGLTHSFTYSDEQAVEYLEIDNSIADLSEISKLTGSQFSGNTDKGISLAKSIEMLEKQGFTKVS